MNNNKIYYGILEEICVCFFVKNDSFPRLHKKTYYKSCATQQENFTLHCNPNLKQ